MSTSIQKLLDVIAALRHPETGCPWDLKQTHSTLRPYMLEEAYEAVEAITSDNPDLIKEELGDVLLQIALHAQIAQDNGLYTFEDVAEGIADKLIRRHPHVFSDTEVSGEGEVLSNWEAIKQAEKAEKGQAAAEKSILANVKKSQPALSVALETSQKAVAVGFEWPNLDSLYACVMSEYDELMQAHKENAPFSDLEDEMGDILFASVNLARHFKINPEVALARATAKFTRRFQTMEALIAARYGDKPLTELQNELDFETWDALWREAKQKVAQKA